MKEAKFLLKIIKSFVENTECPAEEVDEEKLYELAKKHSMSNFLITWAKKNAKSEEIKSKIVNDFNQQIIKDTNENLELEKILQQFEKKQIKTVVFKGILMKNIYPQNYMRQMCDMDILTDETVFKDVSKIMKSLGYEEFYDYEKHLIFQKKPLIFIELHRKLLLEKDVGHEYFDDIWSKCVPYQNYENIFQLNKEDAYIFCILHLMLHFKFTGIQIRDVLDVYLYNEKYKNELDEEKLNRVFEELQISKFEKNIKQIAYQWFGSEKKDDFDDVEKFILQGSSMANQVNFGVDNKGGKSKYMRQLFFPEYKIMKEKYPILKKAPILLPATWIARIFKDIRSKQTTVKARMDTIKLIQETKDEDVKYIHEIYEKLGIIGKE